MGHETGAEHQLLLILDMWVRLKMMMEAMIEDLCMASHMGTMAERPKMEIIGWILKPVRWLSDMWVGVMVMIRMTAMNDDDGDHDHDGDSEGGHEKARSMSLLLTSDQMIAIKIVMEDGDTDTDGHKTNALVG